MATDLSTRVVALIEYLGSKATPQEILDFQISDEIQARTEALLERYSKGEITQEEQAELEHLRDFYQMVSLLQTEALERLNPE